jgi:hypothetical protein
MSDFTRLTKFRLSRKSVGLRSQWREREFFDEMSRTERMFFAMPPFFFISDSKFRTTFSKCRNFAQSGHTDGWSVQGDQMG